MSDRRETGREGGGFKFQAAMPATRPAATARNSARPQARCMWLLGLAVIGTPASEPASAIHFSSS